MLVPKLEINTTAVGVNPSANAPATHSRLGTITVYRARCRRLVLSRASAQSAGSEAIDGASNAISEGPCSQAASAAGSAAARLTDRCASRATGPFAEQSPI